MENDTSANAQNGPAGASLDAESRDDLLQVVSLWEYFCERTAADLRRMYQGKTTGAPLSIIVITLACAIIFIVMNNSLAYIFIALFLAALIWWAFVRSTGGRHNLEADLQELENGKFPQLMRPQIVKRLRWWNFLIVPYEWTHNSRIFDVREHMRGRMEELDKEVEFWKSSEGVAKREEKLRVAQMADERKKEQRQKLKLLQSRGVNVTGLDEEEQTTENKRESFSDPEILAKLIRNPDQRDLHLLRIRRINDPLERALEERVFFAALIFKCDKIITMLDQIEEFNPSLENITADNLDDSVRKVINILEQRRSLVIQVNQISPKKVLPLFTFDYGFTTRAANDDS